MDNYGMDGASNASRNDKRGSRTSPSANRLVRYSKIVEPRCLIKKNKRGASRGMVMIIEKKKKKKKKKQKKSSSEVNEGGLIGAPLDNAHTARAWNFKRTPISHGSREEP